MKTVMFWFVTLLLAVGVGAGLSYSYMKGHAPQTSAVVQPLTTTNRQGQSVPIAPEGGKGPAPMVKSDPSPVSNAGVIADAAAQIEPSVVTIETQYRANVVDPYSMEDPFEASRAAQKIPQGTGSGVIFSPDGIIITNNHVVARATNITVTLNDGRQVAGKVLGTDALTDLAVVKVEENNLPAVTLADSDKVRVGEWVIAVGDPLRVGITVTAGIVSAIRKNQPTGAGTAYNKLIQTDAAINPGNSGGALADIQGRLIGINSAITSTNGGSVGIGYAIPANTVKDVVAQLVETGRVRRPWLGGVFGTLNEQGRQQLGLQNGAGTVIVVEVQPGSPIATAGVQRGDVILNINDQEVKRADELQSILVGMKIGDVANLKLWRSGQERTVSATLTERPVGVK